MSKKKEEKPETALYVLPTMLQLMTLTRPDRIMTEKGEFLMFIGEDMKNTTGFMALAAASSFDETIDSQYRPETVGVYST